MNVIIYGSKRIRYISHPLHTNGVDVYDISALGSVLKRLKAAIQLARCCSKIEDAEIIIDTPHWIGLTALIVTSLYHKRYYLVLRGDVFEERPSRILTKINTIVLMKAKGIIFLNQYLNDRIKKILPDLHHCTVIPPPILSIPKENITVLKSEENVLLTVTNFQYYKKIQPLLTVMDAIDRFLDTYQNARWDICGGGRYFSLLKNKWNTLRHRNRIRLLGYCENVEIYYQRATAFLFFTGLDVHPLVINEAFLNKLPVVVNKSLGLQFIVDNGQDGYLIDMETPNWEEELIGSLSTLINNPEKAKKMGLSGYRKVLSNLNPITIGNKFLEFIKSEI